MMTLAVEACTVFFAALCISLQNKLLTWITLNLVFRLSHFLATWSGVIFPVRPISFTIPLRQSQPQTQKARQREIFALQRADQSVQRSPQTYELLLERLGDKIHLSGLFRNAGSAASPPGRLGGVPPPREQRLV